MLILLLWTVYPSETKYASSYYTCKYTKNNGYWRYSFKAVYLALRIKVTSINMFQINYRPSWNLRTVRRKLSDYNRFCTGVWQWLSHYSNFVLDIVHYLRYIWYTRNFDSMLTTKRLKTGVEPTVETSCKSNMYQIMDKVMCWTIKNSFAYKWENVAWYLMPITGSHVVVYTNLFTFNLKPC
jgi:hypothetical protein